MCPTRPQRTPVLSHVSNQTSEDSRTKSCVQPDLEDSRTKSCVQPDLRGLLYYVMCTTRPQRTPILSHVSNQTSEDSRTKSCVQPDLRGLPY
ncbi:hypothetical protein Pmani_024827 [Petrolisthes manimaculis]|uniref:Uncharacterized protein n=1 Tax=Petrolisthes manimaculis TaxID=1843537 RepID=A0AAE1P9G1_9EUCA|nr:hypothetical protein Pmani_024827 [Petrolisthes manimaculis]